MRVVIFTDVPGTVSARLIPATIRAMRARGDVEPCGFVTSRPGRFRPDPALRARHFVRAALIAATNRAVKLREAWTPPIDLERVARAEGVPVLVPPDGDVNDPEFVERLARELRPSVALSYECLSLFRAPLLAALEQAVNYHSGLSPHYRGVMATSFSVLLGEKESGFTFHRMTEAIDAGPILVQESVPVGSATAAEVGRRKLDRAVAAIPRVLDKVAARAPGQPQVGEGSYFGAREWQAMIRIEHPELLTAEQLARRLRAFGTVRLTIDGIEYPVSRLRTARFGDVRAFRSVDGIRLTPDRFEGLPFFLHWITEGRLDD